MGSPYVAPTLIGNCRVAGSVLSGRRGAVTQHEIRSALKGRIAILVCKAAKQQKNSSSIIHRSVAPVLKVRLVDTGPLVLRAYDGKTSEAGKTLQTSFVDLLPPMT